MNLLNLANTLFSGECSPDWKISKTEEEIVEWCLKDAKTRDVVVALCQYLSKPSIQRLFCDRETEISDEVPMDSSYAVYQLKGEAFWAIKCRTKQQGLKERWAMEKANALLWLLDQSPSSDAEELIDRIMRSTKDRKHGSH